MSEARTIGHIQFIQYINQPSAELSLSTVLSVVGAEFSSPTGPVAEFRLRAGRGEEGGLGASMSTHRQLNSFSILYSGSGH